MSAILALLVFTGCTNKQPAIDATANSSTSGNSGVMPSTTQSATGDNATVIVPVTNANSTDANAGANASNGANAQGITSILFDYDKFDIREDMQANLKANSALLKNKTFKLEGNCDEFGSDEYNFALGLKRANSVKSALVNEGINADSISMTSLGEGNPACLEKTQECWAKNRRVDVKLP
jgi:peptidoglycan-associated lipoprotein